MPKDPTRTSVLTLICDDQAQLRLDPVDVAENPESVAFDISFTWKMPFQTHQFEIRACWILAERLREFEQQLCELVQSANRTAALQNMNGRSILSVSMDGNSAQITLSVADTSHIGDLRFTMNTYALQIEDMYHCLQDYPKWW
ncbi:MAG TPA: hypothetical protein VE890_16825 [Thermoguttaceae bacterium]|nr:hypothetical protein [Thermoguttaceae bacterium]